MTCQPLAVQCFASAYGIAEFIEGGHGNNNKLIDQDQFPRMRSEPGPQRSGQPLEIRSALMTKIRIRPVGAYLQADSFGILPDSTAHSWPNDPWAKPAEQLLERYLDEWGSDIDSIYIRGSVARGLAVPGISDLDSFAVLNSQSFDADHDRRVANWSEAVHSDFRNQFTFMSSVEVDLLPMETILDRENFYAFIMKTESMCIYGENLSSQLWPFKLSEANFQTRHFKQHFHVFISEFPSEPTDQQPDFITWIAKRFLRVGMELVMTRENRYTRDLYLCYKSFTKHYPEQAASMRRTLELALNPETTKEIEAFFHDFGSWLAEEADIALRQTA